MIVEPELRRCAGCGCLVPAGRELCDTCDVDDELADLALELVATLP